MNALGAFLLTAPVAFAIGWFSRDIFDRFNKGNIVSPRTRERLGRFLDWLGQTRNLTVIVVVTAAAVLGGIAYTWTADQQSENRTEDVVSCVAKYVRDAAKQQAPRTLASVAAQDARRDWDAGYSEDAPTLTKDQLKTRYLRLYANYVAVRGNNPTLPAFSLDYCKASDE